MPHFVATINVSLSIKPANLSRVNPSAVLYFLTSGGKSIIRQSVAKSVEVQLFPHSFLHHTHCEAVYLPSYLKTYFSGPPWVPVVSETF